MSSVLQTPRFRHTSLIFPNSSKLKDVFCPFLRILLKSTLLLQCDDVRVLGRADRRVATRK